MAVWLALILGVVQGLTEFLPVSSSGHLLLLEHVFGLGGSNLFFNVLVHFATLVAVVLVFWKEVVYLIKHPFSRQTLNIVLASAITVVVALVFNRLLGVYMPALLGFGFLLTSALLFYTTFKKGSIRKEIGYPQAAVIGLVQGLAIVPGLSRSGSTIAVALAQKAEREEAAKFSFLISLPVIIGGMLFEVIDGVRGGFGQINVVSCIVGFVAAFVTALLTIKLMMKIVKKGRWLPFAIYLLLLGIFVLLNQFWLGLF